MEKEWTEAKNSRLRWLLVIVANFIVIFTILGTCMLYTTREADRNEELKRNSLLSMVVSVEKTAYVYMRAQQEMCNGWSAYINSHPMTEEEALDYLGNATCNPRVMIHFISAETLQGYSARANDKKNNRVDYSTIPAVFSTLENVPDEVDDLIHVTSIYTNPLNGMDVVGFVRKIWLFIDGEKTEYYLIRVIPEARLKDSWSFSGEYEDAELALISENGDYIIRSNSVKNQNFWEYLQINNNLTEEQRDRLAEDMIAGHGIFNEKNAKGEDACYVCHQADQTKNWYFIGYFPVRALKLRGYDWTLVIYVVIGFLILLVIDIAQFVIINRHLAHSMEETRKANIAKTQFLSSMSHDIRTPMNAIIGMTSIAEKYVTDPDHVRDCLDKISLASSHLLTLINDVLDISKIESGRMTINPVAFSLAEMITNLANIAKTDIKAKGIRFDIHLHGVGQENLFADELRLNQIFINLLSNAIKYTNPGGKIVMDLEERPVEGDPEKVELIYTVEDTGIGMSEEYQKKMYETFTRAVDARIDKIQGTGLGLAITKQMVDLMGGTIECESELNKGTKFTVRLTVGVLDRQASDWKLPEMDILIVDDDGIFLETAKNTLEEMNLTVETASDGMTALEKVVDRHEGGKDYPIVIIDWKMPDMDGIETVRAIRSKVGDALPIMVVSSYDWTEVEKEALEAGANGFINKPLFKSTVYRKMNEFFHFDTEAAAGKKSEDDVSDLAGLHFLVAEDNDFNWEIIEELLDVYQIKTDRAINGEICVDMVLRAASGTYDAILMDIQMPVMNGRQAAQAIRAMRDERKKDIPIIALTADAFAEDIKACMDVGMNGHVSKPISKKKLIKELRKIGIVRQQKE